MRDRWNLRWRALIGIWVMAAWIGPRVPVALGAGQEAAEPTETLPSPAEIIGRYVEALGGEAAIRAQQSRHAAGRFELPGQGLSGELHIYAAEPNKLLLEIEFPGVGLARTGFDGEIGWSSDPMMGPRILGGGELDQLRDEADFYGDLHDPANFTIMETVEQTEFDGKECYKVRLVRTSEREYFEYFEIDSGLIIGVEGTQESVMGSLEVVTVLSDYTDFGGVLGPATVTQEFGPGQTAVTTITSADLNTVAESVFELPPEIRALVGGSR